MADGCIDSDTNRVSISQKKEAKTLDELMGRLKDYGITVNKDSQGWRFSNKVLADHLREFGLKHNGGRRIPASILFSKQETIEAFVMAYTYGDGHIRGA